MSRENTNLAKILTGQWGTQVFDRALSLGLVWGFSGEGAATKASLFIAVGAIPHLLFSKSSATLINKIGHRKVLLGSDFLRAFLLLLFFVLFQSTENPFDGYSIFLLSFLINCAAAFYNPAILSAPRFFVSDKKVEKATSLINTGFSLSSVLGPLAFTFLYTKGLEKIFIAATAVYLVSGSLAYFLVEEKESSEELGAEFVEENSVSFFSLPKNITQLLVVFAFMNLALGPLQVFLPLFAKEATGGLIDYARYEFSLAIGLLLGGVVPMLSFNKVAASENNYSKKIPILFWVLAMAYFVFSVSGSEALLLGSLFIMGASLGFANVILLSYFQSAVVLTLVPALMSAVNLISTASLPLSMSLSGFLLSIIPTRSLAISCAVFLILLVFLFQINLREKRSFENVSVS